ncbi:MAG TPA: nucleoside triphosphate pyrophosphohydrolase [Candidatus Methanoperedens sp.]|nr:nucleoside triphosphate pyrophosphohydrolase [Candidatus Methanoperedens sp.]
MKKYFHRKLIRDKIPEIIEQNEGHCETKVLNDIEYELELKKKLIEEAIELQRAKDEEIVGELADVLELVKSIASYKGVEFCKVEEKQISKKEKRGGFDKKIFLEWSDQESGK